MSTRLWHKEQMKELTRRDSCPWCTCREFRRRRRDEWPVRCCKLPLPADRIVQEFRKPERGQPRGPPYSRPAVRGWVSREARVRPLLVTRPWRGGGGESCLTLASCWRMRGTSAMELSVVVYFFSSRPTPSGIRTDAMWSAARCG